MSPGFSSTVGTAIVGAGLVVVGAGVVAGVVDVVTVWATTGGDGELPPLEKQELAVTPAPLPAAKGKAKAKAAAKAATSEATAN